MRNSWMLFIAGLVLSVSAHAGELGNGWHLSGFTAFENRQFLKGHQLPNQHSGTAAPSFVLEPEIYKKTDTDTFTARFLYRYDVQDDERTHFDIRQLDWIRAKNDWEISAGISKVFWGVTESRHLVDIINQTDNLEDLDGEDKLGQPMIQLATFQSWGDLRFYYLPYFRARKFSGAEGRLRGPLLVDNNNAVYTHSAGEWHPDFAVRYQHYIGSWDFGFSHFHGTSRAPILREITKGKLTPVYEIIDQTGIDAQYTSGSWLWKLEAMGRAGHGDYFGAATGGFEYTMYGVFGTSSDVGVLVEYHRDGRDDDAPSTTFDNDVFIGTRVTLNDTDDTEFLGGMVMDVNDRSHSFFVEASTRINNHVKVEVEGHVFANIDRDQIAYHSRDDDYIQMRLSYHF